MSRLLLFVCILFFYPQFAFADIRLVVLDFRGVGASAELLKELSDEARSGVLEGSKGRKIQGEKLSIISRKKMKRMLKKHGLSTKDCIGSCEVDLAQKIGADYVVSGKLELVDGQEGEGYVLSIKLHDTAQNALFAHESVMAEKKQELLSEARDVGRLFFSGEGYQVASIRSGRFTMGCTQGDNDCKDNEKPPHPVTLRRGFVMMSTEVTQGLYEDVMGSNPSESKRCGRNCPVENISWYDAVQMANRLSKQEGLEVCYQIASGEEPTVTWANKKCKGWRLPTEAEWEYAARGGESYKYAGSNDLGSVAWYTENSDYETHPVGLKKANGYGLYDMSGNVWEWVWDFALVDGSLNHVEESKYTTNPRVDPVVESSFPNRIYRGGGYLYGESDSRVSVREIAMPSSRNHLGFRLVRTSK